MIYGQDAKNGMMVTKTRDGASSSVVRIAELLRPCAVTRMLE